MTKTLSLTAIKSLLVAAYLIGPSAGANDIVSDDLLTSSNSSSEWLACDSASQAIDVTNLDAGGCAFRTTPVSQGITYKLTCGITVAKFASITLAYLDANDNTLASDSTEVTEHVTGAYSVTLQAPANTTTAAIGIYGETGSGFQDCVLVDATPVETPTKGRIAGITWLDENGDSVFNPTETFITNTPVALFSNGKQIEELTTNVNNGRYSFGNLDLDQCYTVSFGVADTSLELAAAGGENDAGNNGLSEEICLTSNNIYQLDIDAAYVPVTPEAAPADYVLCGNAWDDVNGNGLVDSNDTRIENIRVALFDTNDKRIARKRFQDGRFAYTDLAAGRYRIRILDTDGYEVPYERADSIEQTNNNVNGLGESPWINLPGDANTDANNACTVAHIDGLYTKTEVALEPTVANDDAVTQVVGADIRFSILDNDQACDGVAEVDLISHDVPGRVLFNKNSEKMVILDTTDAGVYSIEYGIRGACGSYDTATLTVTLTEPVVTVPTNAPEAPVCRVETGGNVNNGGVDVFSPDEEGYATQYNFYDRDKAFVVSVFSNDFTGILFIGEDANEWRAPWIGNFEKEWNGAAYGYDQVSVYYASAVENNVESTLTECARTATSPIALDIHGKGRIQQVTGLFEVDFNNDGIEEALGYWFAPTAGILVNDDASGKISGKDLYGNIPGVYADGFEELKALDVNVDGQLTDEELVGLAIWTDLNSDTIVDESELSSLADHKVVGLAVNHKKFMARATLSNGKTMLMEDVWLHHAPMAELNKQ